MDVLIFVDAHLPLLFTALLALSKTWVNITSFMKPAPPLLRWMLLGNVLEKRSVTQTAPQSDKDLVKIQQVKRQ